MPILYRYIMRELLLVFIVTSVVLLLIGLGGRFIGYLQDAALGKFAADALVPLLVLRLPEFFQLTLPFAFYIALILTVSRLFADRELTVLFAAGVPPARILRWFLVIAGLLALLVGYLSLSVTPASEVERAQFMLEQRVRSEFDALTAGVFHTFSGGRRVTYAEDISADRRQLREVFVAQNDPDAGSTTIWAERGSQYVDADTGSRFLLLEDGVRYEGKPGAGDYRVVEFGALGQRIERPDPVVERLRISSQPNAQLLSDGSGEAMAELHWRLSLPIMVMVATFFGVGLAKARPREGRFSNFVPALLAFLGYYLALLLNQYALVEGLVPIVFGFWGVHVLFLLIGAFFTGRLAQPAASS